MTSFVWVQGLHQSNPPHKLLDGWQAVQPPLNMQRGTRCGHGRAVQPYVWTRTRIQVLLPSDLCPPDRLPLASPWHLLSLMGRCWNTRSERAFFHLTLESFLAIWFIRKIHQKTEIGQLRKPECDRKLDRSWISVLKQTAVEFYIVVILKEQPWT